MQTDIGVGNWQLSKSHAHVQVDASCSCVVLPVQACSDGQRVGVESSVRMGENSAVVWFLRRGRCCGAGEHPDRRHTQGGRGRTKHGLVARCGWCEGVSQCANPTLCIRLGGTSRVSACGVCCAEHDGGKGMRPQAAAAHVACGGAAVHVACDGAAAAVYIACGGAAAHAACGVQLRTSHTVMQLFTLHAAAHTAVLSCVSASGTLKSCCHHLATLCSGAFPLPFSRRSAVRHPQNCCVLRHRAGDAVCVHGRAGQGKGPHVVAVRLREGPPRRPRRRDGLLQHMPPILADRCAALRVAHPSVVCVPGAGRRGVGLRHVQCHPLCDHGDFGLAARRRRRARLGDAPSGRAKVGVARCALCAAARGRRVRRVLPCGARLPSVPALM
eukprot:350066-Chlamydomonas_euryale.AAC.6